MVAPTIHNHYLRAAENGADQGAVKGIKTPGNAERWGVGGRKQAMQFDLRFPTGPELSEPLIGSCNSALIWLGQSMHCRLASCDREAIRPDVKNPIIPSVPGNVQFSLQDS